MTAFLLALSLLLNIIALFSILLLFLRQNKLLEAERNQQNMFNEMEEVISSYLLQMKEENDDFIGRVSKLKVNELMRDPEENPELNRNEVGLSGKNVRIAKASAYHAAKAYQKNYQPGSQSIDEIEQTEPNLANEGAVGMQSGQGMSDDVNQPGHSLVEEVLLLKQQGITEDEIAKTLGKGRTEIALMLKFRQNQQE